MTYYLFKKDTMDRKADASIEILVILKLLAEFRKWKEIEHYLAERQKNGLWLDFTFQIKDFMFFLLDLLFNISFILFYYPPPTNLSLSLSLSLSLFLSLNLLSLALPPLCMYFFSSVFFMCFCCIAGEDNNTDG